MVVFFVVFVYFMRRRDGEGLGVRRWEVGGGRVLFNWGSYFGRVRCLGERRVRVGGKMVMVGGV